MNRKRKLDAIVATFTERSQAFFSSSAKPGKDYDYVRTYLIHASFDLFAVHNLLPQRGNDGKQDTRGSEARPDARPEARPDAASGSAGKSAPGPIGGESTLRVRLGTVSGYLMLCPEMLYDHFDPLTVCDDHSAELEYVMSALSDTGGPLNGKTGEPMQNVFYIENLEIDPAYKTQRLGLRIIRELPYLVREFLHVYPDLLAYRPAPLASEWDDVSERVHALRTFAMERLSNRIEEMLAEKGANGGTPARDRSGKADDAEESGRGGSSPKSGQTDDAASLPTAGPPGVPAGEGAAANGKRVATIAIKMPEYDFSDDEINLIMGRRSSLSEYPESLKDAEQFHFFEKCGFREVPGSHLLFRKTM